MAIHFGNADFDGTVVVVTDTEEEIASIETAGMIPGSAAIVAVNGLPTYVLNASGTFVKVG